MSRPPAWSAVLLASALHAACGDSSASTHQKAPPPPAMPVPQAPIAPPSTVEPTREEERTPARAAEDKSARESARAGTHKKGEDKPSTAKAPKPSRTVEKPQASSVKPAAPAPAAQPSPAPKAANDPEKPKSKVRIPETARLSIQVPPGLQEDLDRDPRMQPWANQVVSVIDGCYGKSGGGPGTVEVRITMHENARPDADLGGVPNSLAPIVACATGGLLRTKMPLFTGREGQRYTVRVQFK